MGEFNKMNHEVDMPNTRVVPIVNALAKEYSVEFSPKRSDYLSRFCEHDETAKMIFDSLVTVSHVDFSCGGISLTTASQLEETYRFTPSREKELLDNNIFLFAIDGDGSFFGFGLGNRQFYHFDFGPWVEEELPWDQCCSDQWDTKGFCDFFVKEHELP